MQNIFKKLTFGLGTRAKGTGQRAAAKLQITESRALWQQSGIIKRIVGV